MCTFSPVDLGSRTLFHATESLQEQQEARRTDHNKKRHKRSDEARQKERNVRNEQLRKKRQLEISGEQEVGQTDHNKKRRVQFGGL